MSIETVRTVPRPAYSTQLMVLILDGNVEIGALVSSNLCYLIWVRNLIRSRGVTNQFVFLRKDASKKITSYKVIFSIITNL